MNYEFSFNQSTLTFDYTQCVLISDTSKADTIEPVDSTKNCLAYISANQTLGTYTLTSG